MKIIIGGDVVPTKSNYTDFSSSDFFNKLDEKFIIKWKNADIRIFNLECPLGECSTLKAIEKSGPNLISPSDCILGLKSLDPNLICLANNHILDYGINGLNNTINLLKKYKIQYTGIIENIDSKLDVKYFYKDNVKVGVYNMCETEFCNANDFSLGANPYKDYETIKDIKGIKNNCDFLIIIYHGGKEFYRYPSPGLKKRCEELINAGADFITCQHSHCIGCEEKYNNGIILYGQGNFIFDNIDDEYWNTGLLVELDIEKNKFKINYIPIERFNNNFKISEDKIILEEFKNRTDKVYDDEFLNNNYKKFAETKLNDYIKKFEYYNFFDKVYRKIFKKNPCRKYEKQFYLDLLNSIRCEAHRELLIKGLEDKINSN